MASQGSHLCPLPLCRKFPLHICIPPSTSLGLLPLSAPASFPSPHRLRPLSWPSWSYLPPLSPFSQPTCLHRFPNGPHQRTTMKRPYPWDRASPLSTSAPTVSFWSPQPPQTGTPLLKLPCVLPGLELQAQHPPSPLYNRG